MQLNEYQKQAMSFRKESAHAMYALINLSGEVGELHSLIAKAMRDGAKKDHEDNIKKELGDILWHVAAIAEDNDIALSEVAATNIEKLTSRQERNVISGSGDNR